MSDPSSFSCQHVIMLLHSLNAFLPDMSVTPSRLLLASSSPSISVGLMMLQLMMLLGSRKTIAQLCLPPYMWIASS